MITREEFKERAQVFTLISQKDITADDSPLWSVERRMKIKPEWFICINRDTLDVDLKDYWNWCYTHLSGELICYLSSDKHGEWWGFTNKDDIVIWLLKWS